MFYCDNYYQLIENKNLNQPHILIEIGFIINELLKIENFEAAHNTLYLSDDEKNLIKMIRDNEIIKIIINKSNDGEKTIKIDVKERSKKIKQTKISSLIKIIKEKDFSKLDIFRSDGKNIFYSVEKKYKLKD